MIILAKLKKDFKIYQKLVFLLNVMSLVLPVAFSGLIYYLLSEFTELKTNEIVLILSLNLLVTISLVVLYYKKQLDKGLGSVKNVAEIANTPMKDIKTFASPFINQLLLEHENMKKNKEIS